MDGKLCASRPFSQRLFVEVALGGMKQRVGHEDPLELAGKIAGSADDANGTDAELLGHRPRRRRRCGRGHRFDALDQRGTGMSGKPVLRSRVVGLTRHRPVDQLDPSPRQNDGRRHCSAGDHEYGPSRM